MNKIEIPFSHRLFNGLPKNTTWEDQEKNLIEKINKKIKLYKEKYNYDIISNIINDNKYFMDIDSYIFLKDNINRLIMYEDINDLSFVLGFDMRLEKIKMIYPHMIYDESFYEGYDPSEFMKLNDYNKLLWMYNNLEFIPITVYDENFNDNLSHKFSHIKNNEGTYEKIKDFVDNSEYYFNNNAFYYIIRNYKNNSYILKRDTNLSPYNNK